MSAKQRQRICLEAAGEHALCLECETEAFTQPPSSSRRGSPEPGPALGIVATSCDQPPSCLTLILQQFFKLELN